MYHYVRNNDDFEYNVFCRGKKEFEDQVQFLNKNLYHCPLTNKEEIDYFLKSDEESFVLTFDDGYKEHLDCARYLNKIGINGIFFPSHNIFQNQFLDANLIHLIIGSRKSNIGNLIEQIQYYIDTYGIEIKSVLFNYFGKSIDEYINSVKPKRGQSIEISAIKFLLQRDLNGKHNRKKILDELFKKYYKKNQDYYFKNFYLTISDMYEMQELGSKFGSHGITHKHFDSLSKSDQQNEIRKSIENFIDLKLIGKEDLKMVCYPYGSYNAETIKIMIRNKIDLGFITVPKGARLNSKDTLYTLPRWDTNHWWDKTSGKPIFPLK